MNPDSPMKGKPAERRGRKATGLRVGVTPATTAGLPKQNLRYYLTAKAPILSGRCFLCLQAPEMTVIEYGEALYRFSTAPPMSLSCHLRQQGSVPELDGSLGFPEAKGNKKPNALSGEVYISDRLSVCKGGMVNEENPWEANVD